MNAILSRLTIVVVVVASATGCRMADPLYDPCSPVMTRQMPADPLCDPLFRLGSVYYRNGTYSSGRLDSGETFAASDAASSGAQGVEKTAPARATVPRRVAPAAVPSVSKPASSPSPSSVPISAPVQGGGTKFRTPNTATPPLPTPVPSAPWDAPALPTLPETPLTPPADPAAARDAGITLETLRQSDPSITDVEIVEIRDGGTRVR